MLAKAPEGDGWQGTNGRTGDTLSPDHQSPDTSSTVGQQPATRAAQHPRKADEQKSNEIFITSPVLNTMRERKIQKATPKPLAQWLEGSDAEKRREHSFTEKKEQ